LNKNLRQPCESVRSLTYEMFIENLRTAGTDATLLDSFAHRYLNSDAARSHMKPSERDIDDHVWHSRGLPLSTESIPWCPCRSCQREC
ncbi:MAG: hypothetical protein ABIO14_00130, partial [Aeromicrobium sp.]